MEKVKILSKEEIQHLEKQAEGLIYLVYQLGDIQEGLITDAEEMLKNAGDYRFNIKRNINQIKRITGELRSDVLKLHPEQIDSVTKFGEESDNLRKHIEEYFYEAAKDEFIPFGDDWEKDMMKLTKVQIIEMYKRACKSRD